MYVKQDYLRYQLCQCAGLTTR